MQCQESMAKINYAIKSCVMATAYVISVMKKLKLYILLWGWFTKGVETVHLTKWIRISHIHFNHPTMYKNKSCFSHSHDWAFKMNIAVSYFGALANFHNHLVNYIQSIDLFFLFFYRLASGKITVGIWLQGENVNTYIPW